MLVSLNLDERVKVIPDLELRDSVLRVIDLKLSSIENDIRKRCSDALADEVNFHASHAERQHPEVEYSIYSFGRLPLKIMAAMPRHRCYNGLEGVECRLVTFRSTICEAEALLDSFARDLHRYCPPEQAALDIKVLLELSKKNVLTGYDWPCFLEHARAVVEFRCREPEWSSKSRAEGSKADAPLAITSTCGKGKNHPMVLRSVSGSTDTSSHLGSDSKASTKNNV